MASSPVPKLGVLSKHSPEHWHQCRPCGWANSTTINLPQIGHSPGSACFVSSGIAYLKSLSMQRAGSIRLMRGLGLSMAYHVPSGQAGLFPVLLCRLVPPDFNGLDFHQIMPKTSFYVLHGTTHRLPACLSTPPLQFFTPLQSPWPDASCAGSHRAARAGQQSHAPTPSICPARPPIPAASG